MVNLIIEKIKKPCPYFIFIDKMTVYSYWQQVERVCATQQQSADYLDATAYLFEAKPLLLPQPVRTGCKWTQFLAHCTSQINNCAYPALQYN